MCVTKRPGKDSMQGPADPLEWARHPRSQTAMKLVQEGAQTHRPLRAIFLAHVASGVADANGKLLLRWDGAQWRALR